MKYLFVFLIIMAGFPVFGQGFTDSVTIGLPLQSGTVPFRFKLSQPSPVPAGGYQGMVLFAVPREKQAQVQTDFARASVLAFATQNRLALVMVKTASDTSFAQLSQPAVLGDSIRAGLSRLAAASGRPEFQHAPLFAAGFAGCFASSIKFSAQGMKLDIGLVEVDGSYGLKVQLAAKVPGVSGEARDKVIAEAKRVCAYTNATRGNVPFELTLL